MRDREEIERWLLALERLVPVPAEHSEPTVPLADASAFLRCSEPAFEELVAVGLPVRGGHLDRTDLVNLALLSHSGESVPEVGLRHSFRFVTQNERAWCEARRWRFGVKFVCSEAASTSEAGEPAERWTMWPPLSWPPAPGPSEGPLRLHGARASAHYEVRTEGATRKVSNALGELIDGYLGERRFVRMPFAVQAEGDWMADRGLFDCFSGSVELQRRCKAMEMEARVRQGWLFGIAASRHAWVEVQDRDGEWKDVDPAFRTIATALYPQCDDFHRFCVGSRLNRVLATDCPPTESPLAHACDAAEAVVSMEVWIADAARA